MEALTREERIGYLANVLRVAHSDGDLTVPERQVFDDVAARLGAGASEIAEARQTVVSGEEEFRNCGAAVGQRGTFDDMLLMSMVDGQFDQAEQTLLEAFAARIGLSQADVNMALRRAANRLAELRKRMPSQHPASPPRPSARAQAPASASRRPAPAAATARTAYVRSRRVDPEAAPVRKAPPAVPSERIRGPWEDRTEPGSGVVPAEPAAAPLPPPTDAAAASAEPPPAVSAPAVPTVSTSTDSGPETDLERCVRARSAAADPTAYCYACGTREANPWGCRLLGMPLAPGADWLAHGTFRDAHSFVFDIERVSQVVEQHLTAVSACPHLNLTQILRTLSVFPKRAMVGPLWAWRPAKPGEVGAFVSHRRHLHGCGVGSTLRATAPDPVGEALLRRLLRDTRAPV